MLVAALFKLTIRCHELLCGENRSNFRPQKIGVIELFFQHHLLVQQ